MKMCLLVDVCIDIVETFHSTGFIDTLSSVNTPRTMPMHRFVVSNCLFNIDDRYQVEKFLGKGSYGVVWYVVYFSSSLLLFFSSSSIDIDIDVFIYSYFHYS